MRHKCNSKQRMLGYFGNPFTKRSYLQTSAWPHWQSLPKLTRQVATRCKIRCPYVMRN
jgi:hypothetical protein